MTSKKTILIIDDESHISDSLRDFFQDDGYNVLTASDGETGLEIFFNEKIDVIITDLRMPKKDGIEVMQAVNQYNPEIPTIVISGAGTEEDIINALRLGAKDYIKKPIIDMNRISLVVKQVLENRRLNEENRHYREQLEASEHQYRTITENIAEGVFTVDEFENFTYTNSAFCKVTGYSKDEILHKNLKDVSTEDSFNIIQEKTLERKKGLADRYEIKIFSKEMKHVHVELACNPVWNDKEEYIGAIAIVRDITKIVDLRKKYLRFFIQKNETSKNLLPICANCKNIKTEESNWISMEEYFHKIKFSHGICPECCQKLYPEFDLS